MVISSSAAYVLPQYPCGKYGNDVIQDRDRYWPHQRDVHTYIWAS